MRDLFRVIAEIVAVAPDLEECLKDVASSSRYSPPELQAVFWREAAAILEEYAPASHPKADEIARIFNGTPQESQPTKDQ